MANNYSGFYFAPTLSVSMSDIGKTQDWQMDGIVTDRYVKRNGLLFSPVYGLSGGYGFVFPRSDTALLLGMGIYKTGAYLAKGVIQQDRDPTEENLAYTFKVTNLRIMMETKLLSLVSRSLSPFISAGIGYGNNRAMDYKETSRDGDKTLPNKPFANASVDDLAYEFGIGMGYKLNRIVSFIISDNFICIGDAHLGASLGQITNDRIHTGNIYTNDIRAGVTIFI